MTGRADVPGALDGRPDVAHVFDFDGVIATGDTMASAVAVALSRSPLRALAAAPLAIAWLLVGRWLPVRGVLSRLLVRIAFGGVGGTSYAEFAARHGSRLAGRASWRNQTAIRAVGAAVDSGSQVIICTATEESLARSFLGAVGLGSVPLAATELTFFRGRLRHRRHNLGEEKVRELDRRGFPLDNAVLVTDSAADLPLARRARRVVLVSPRRDDVRLFERVAAEVIEVHWSIDG